MALIDPENSALGKLGYSLETDFYQTFLDKASGVAEALPSITGTTVEEVEEMTDDELEEWLKKNHLGDPNSELTQAFEGVPRTAENNYGYIDKPMLMNFAGFIPGAIGMAAGAANLFMNINNVIAVNDARKDLGLEPMSIAETIKGAIFGASKVGQVEIDGKKVNVDLDPDKQKTDKKGVETVDAKTAKAGVEAVKADVARTAEPITSTRESLPAVSATPAQGFVDVSTPPMTSSPAGGARAASGVGMGWEPDIDVAVTDPDVKGEVQNSGKGLAALAPNGLVGQTDSVVGKNGMDWSKGLTEDTKAATDYLGNAVGGVTVTSGMRTTEENSKLSDGARRSTHLSGEGIDVRINNLNDDQKANLVANARDAGFTRAIVYDDHLHFDTKPTDSDKMIGWTAPGNKEQSWFQEGLTRELTPKEIDTVPGQRDVAIAQIEAMEAPAAKGFIGSPEVASSKPGATDVPTSIAETSVTAPTASGLMSPTTEPLNSDINQSRFGPTEDTFFNEESEVNPSRFGTVDPTENVDGARFGQPQDPNLNETFDENRVGYPAPSTLSTDTYGDKLGLWNNSPVNPVELTNVTPAQYAALGFVERSPEQITSIAHTLAGELSARSLEDLTGVNGVAAQREAQTELANMIATVENREASGKFSNVLSGSQYNSNLSRNAATTAANFSKFGSVLEPLVSSFYTPEGIKASNYAATHYYNPDIVNPSWGSKMSNVETVGKHTFGTLDSKYDVPVTEEFKAEVAGTQLGLMGDNVPTPTPNLTSLPSVEDAGKGFVGSPEAQTSLATPMTDAMAAPAPVAPTVDTGKAFGESFGSGWGEQSLAGATAENTGFADNPSAKSGEESFGGFSAGSVGESPGVTGQSDFSSAGGGFVSNSEEGKESSGGSISVTSVSTGETSTGSLGGGGEGSSSLSSSLSEAFGGWGDESSISTDASSDGEDGEDSNDGW